MKNRPPVFSQKTHALLDSVQAPGLYLHRIYPPTMATAVRSRLGGIPNLPEHISWPRGKSYDRDVPFHFLAQIDCAELPHIDKRMPEKGMLFFFASDDEEQIWQEETPGERIRVLYIALVPLDTPPRNPPHDLPPIKDRVASEQAFRPDWLLPHEHGPAIHSPWPIVAIPIDTWPDADALNMGTREGLDESIHARRVGAIVAATGLPTRSQYVPEWEKRSTFTLPEDVSGCTKFPQLGIMIDRITRRIIRQVGTPMDELAGGLAKARYWISRSAEIGHDSSPSDAEKDEFQKWLREVNEDPLLPDNFGWYFPGILTKGLLDSISYAAASIELSNKIPPYFYNILENHHLPFYQTKYGMNVECGDWKNRAENHQMLGHVSGIQSTSALYKPDKSPSIMMSKIRKFLGMKGPEYSDTICLLRLVGDDGVGFEFGDAGFASFWIKSADLEQRNFDACWAEVDCY